MLGDRVWKVVPGVDPGLSFMIHSMLCLKDPQKTLGLADGAAVTFVVAAPTARHSQDIVYGQVGRLVKGSPWFE